MCVVREVPFAPDVWSLAAALRGAPGLVVLHGEPWGALHPVEASSTFLACDPVEERTDWLEAAGAVVRPAHEHDGPVAPRWVGVVPYEATRELERKGWTPDDARPAPLIARPIGRRYDAAVRIDHASGRVFIEADHDVAASRLLARLRARKSVVAPFARLLPTGTVAEERAEEEAHAERVRRALRYIERGDIYLVNLARRLRFGVRGDPLALFRRMFEAAPAPYAMYAELGGVTVCAASPELALEVRGDRLRTAPIKGTRPRGDDVASDTRLARELDADPKERAELTLAIDLHRNDLGRVAEPGSVRMVGAPRLLCGRTVWSRAAEIIARRLPDVSPADVARAVLPCGSVTGAPKVRAMEIIAELEAHRRGLYTGAFGYVGRDGSLVLAMAIRTLQVAGEEAHYFTGGGVVADSDPLREVEETRWKAAQVHALLRSSRGPVRAVGFSQEKGTS
jgi:anthranilate/para-aminobenzoate synthase component I